MLKITAIKNSNRYYCSYQIPLLYETNLFNRLFGLFFISIQLLLVKAEKHAEWVVVNLEQYHLPVPEYGFVVGFKIFPASFYGQKNGFVKSEDMVTPKLAIKTYLRKSNDAWRRNLIRNSRWQKEDRSHFGIRAMIAEPK
ncbi:hypothetical protein [Nubsella zeaxanthinifaciens]|uniref:hypothetical protein n=1 Tax=Nubsella zeaxanthinifaciens TaxID=392412 RepID=UPI000DE56BE1|nr:hypothetical protein [Nubsella zeaxanthinifaciens]